MKKPVLVVGSLNMDLVVQAARHPQAGEALWGSAFNSSPEGLTCAPYSSGLSSWS